MSPQAKITGQIIKVDGPAGEEAVIVQLEVDCPLCGTFTIQIRDHHLANLRDLIIEAMDLYPELTKAPKVSQREDFKFAGRPHDPTAN
jgi:hypothetical protein